MFLRILKKDLKRKKTMNIILLLFIILCSMFAAASVNNIVAVTGGIEHYFDLADMPDATMSCIGAVDIEDKVRVLPGVDEVKKEHYLFVMSSNQFRLHGKELKNFLNPAGVINEKEMAIRYFDENDNVIDHVEKHGFYATSPFLKNSDIQVGDELELTVGDCVMKLRFLGRMKAATCSTEDTSNPFLLLATEDYDRLAQEEDAHTFEYRKLYVRTTDVEALRTLANDYDNVSVTTRKESKKLFLYDMIAAYIMMVISIVLMMTAFVVLRFTIGFTISEEFREIGVMKAVGIDSGSIRRLYLVKYLAISVIGAAVGFAGSIPLGDAMVKTVSANLVLSSDNSSLMGVFSSAAVVLVILLFCYTCTRRINKLSPIDAVRSGQTGERFGKKSSLHLGRSKLPSTSFLALNDVVSAPKQFTIITIVFTLCILMITLLSSMALTLKSDKILWLFGVPEDSQVHIMDSDWWNNALINQSNREQILEDTEKLLKDNGMPGRCAMMLANSYEMSHGDVKSSTFIMQTKGRLDTPIRMDEGYAPQKPDEIAMTSTALKELNAQVGDRVKAVIGDKEYEFIITGRYSSFNSPSATVCSDFDFGHLPMTGTAGISIRFDGDPDQTVIDKNVTKLRDLLDTDKVSNSSDMIKSMTGMSDTLNTIKHLMLILTVIVTALIAVLMERSFISKEKSEIALMKAVGVRNTSIIGQHALRFAVVSLLASILASAVLMPVSDSLMNWICKNIGDVSGIHCDINPVECFAVCPIILIGVAVIGSMLTALYTGSIKASDTACIE